MNIFAGFFGPQDERVQFQNGVRAVNRMLSFRGAFEFDERFGPLQVKISPLERSLNSLHLFEFNLLPDQLPLVQRISVGVLAEDGSLVTAAKTDMTGKAWMKVPFGKFGLHLVSEAQDSKDSEVEEAAKQATPSLISDEFDSTFRIGFYLQVLRASKARLSQEEAASNLTTLRGEVVKVSDLKEIERGKSNPTFNDLNELLFVYRSTMEDLLQIDAEYSVFDLTVEQEIRRRGIE